MLFRTRQKPKYINEKVKAEIQEKGFSVYNYISLEELILTARKDFLDILSKINIPFGITSIGLGIFSYYVGLIFIFVLPFFLFIVYFIIFNILFFKLIKRTKLFLYVSDVVYTKTGIIISDDYLYYGKDQLKIEKKLKKYSNIFSEYLGKPSNLEEIIFRKKREISDLGMKKAGSLLKGALKVGNNRHSSGLIFVLMVSMFLYALSLYIFYYIGYFFLFLLSKIYIFFLKIVVSFKDKIELKIKNTTLGIDKKLEKMNIIYKVLKNKIDEFESGEISDIGNFVEDKFGDFYNQIDLILKDVKKLKNYIEESKYNNVIDFNIFKKYLKKHFNNPVKDMISLLETYEKMLVKQINDFKKSNKNSKKQRLDINNTEILDKNLEQKEFMLNQKLEILRNNKKNLENSMLK